MASINKVILIGNLGRDPETRYTTDGGTAITTLNIATTRRYRNAEGQTVSETEWHRVVLCAGLAEIAKEYLHKGSQCYIEGRLRTRKYQAKDGTDRYATEIIGETICSSSTAASPTTRAWGTTASKALRAPRVPLPSQLPSQPARAPR